MSYTLRRYHLSRSQSAGKPTRNERPTGHAPLALPSGCLVARPPVVSVFAGSTSLRLSTTVHSGRRRWISSPAASAHPRPPSHVVHRRRPDRIARQGEVAHIRPRVDIHTATQRVQSGTKPTADASQPQSRGQTRRAHLAPLSLILALLLSLQSFARSTRV